MPAYGGRQARQFAAPAAAPRISPLHHIQGLERGVGCCVGKGDLTPRTDGVTESFTGRGAGSIGSRVSGTGEQELHVGPKWPGARGGCFFRSGSPALQGREGTASKKNGGASRGCGSLHGASPVPTAGLNEASITSSSSITAHPLAHAPHPCASIPQALKTPSPAGAQRSGDRRELLAGPVAYAYALGPAMSADRIRGGNQKRPAVRPA